MHMVKHLYSRHQSKVNKL